MSIVHNNPGMTVVATAVIDRNRLVTRLGAHCGADAVNDVLGVSEASAAIGGTVPLRFKSAGTLRCVASVAITIDALVYKAAAGKVGLTGANAIVGRALSAASGDNVEIIVQPIG